MKAGNLNVSCSTAVFFLWLFIFDECSDRVQLMVQKFKKQLEKIHSDIDSCYSCQSFIDNLMKPIGLQRGDRSKIMLIGQEPGKMELKKRMAFAGNAGKRLNIWLRECRDNIVNIRSGLYITAIIKCVCPSLEYYSKMKKNCDHFLNRQIKAIKPQLIITLGQKAFDCLNFTNLTFNDALCQVHFSEKHLIITHYGFHFALLAWPHPSGLNRWLNREENKRALKESFSKARTYFKELL
jgi:uracil-DNA glycosylase family 4